MGLYFGIKNSKNPPQRSLLPFCLEVQIGAG